MMQKRKCAKCGKMFQPTNSQSKYCSPECKVGAIAKNKKHTKKAEPKKVKVVSHEKIKLPAVKAKKPTTKKEVKSGLPKMPKGCDTMVLVHNPNGNHHKVIGLLLHGILNELKMLASSSSSKK